MRWFGSHALTIRCPSRYTKRHNMLVKCYGLRIGLPGKLLNGLKILVGNRSRWIQWILYPGWAPGRLSTVIVGSWIEDSLYAAIAISSLFTLGNPHHYNFVIGAATWSCNMRAVSQRPAGLLDSNHPSVEVIASCRPVATHACFACPFRIFVVGWHSDSFKSRFAWVSRCVR